MSFWTDIRDFVEAPVVTVGNILATPFLAIGSIIDGQNVGDVIKTSVQRDVGGYLNSQLPSFAVARTEAGQGILKNKITDKLTFGYSSDVAGASLSAQKLESGSDLSRSETVELGRFGLKSGVGVGVGMGAAALGAGAGTVAPAYGAAQGVAAKNYFGAGASLIGGLGVGENLGGTGIDLSQIVGGLAPKTAKTSAPKKTLSGYPLSTQSGYDGGESGSGGVSILVIGGMAVAGFFILKKLRKI